VRESVSTPFLDPFSELSTFGGETRIQTVCGVVDRLRLVKASNDPQWLRRVAVDGDIQLTVRKAADCRLRKLAKTALSYQ
jgi:hypothetical protein